MYRAGVNLEGAKQERRDAEDNSHMGTDVYQDHNDMDLGEGVHDFD